MPLEIAQLGQPILRQVAQDVLPDSIDTADIQKLIDEMAETMKLAKGVGLAAPQVFVGRRLFLANILPPERPGEKARTEAFINPRLSQLSADKDSAWEGCLSFLELQVLVPRHRSLVIDYLDRRGQARTLALEGFPARVVQHEFDHLEGILTIDRASSTRNIIKASEADDAIEY